MLSNSFEDVFSAYLGERCVEQIHMMEMRNRDWIEVDYEDFYVYDPDAALLLLENYGKHKSTLDSIITQRLKHVSPEYAEQVNGATVRFINLLQTMPIWSIKSGTMDRLIQVEGTVVQRGKSLVRVINMAFRCKSCGMIIHVPQTEQYRKYPQPCECKGKGWIHIYKESTFEDYQEIVIQEYMENTENGGSPDKLKVALTGSLIRSCEAGENIIITGTIEAHDPSHRSRQIELDYHLEANSLINVTDANTITLTTEDEKQIQEYMAHPEHKQRVIDSIAPTLYGLRHVKEALAYQQCEGQVKHINNTRKRGQFHILLAGPPGCGKSELGDFMVKCHPKGRKAIGRGATGVGLTASVVKDGEQFVLKAGAMALADKGFLFVDEIEKMNPIDSGAMHPGMEQQEVNIDKADISAIVKTRCGVLAACNPLDGVWNDYKTLIGNLHDKGRGLALPLLDRFALIFIIKQNIDTAIEEKVIDHIMKINVSPKTLTPPYGLDILHKIFSYARKINVKTTPEVTRRLSQFYMTLYEASKKNEALIITRRQPEDLVRITEASARLHGRSEATLEDAENAINIVAKSMKEYGIDPDTGKIDQTKALYGRPKTQSEKLAEIPIVIERLRERNIDSTKVSRIMLVKYLCNLWRCEEGEVGRIIEIALKDGTVYCPTPYDINTS